MAISFPERSTMMSLLSLSSAATVLQAVLSNIVQLHRASIPVSHAGYWEGCSYVFLSKNRSLQHTNTKGTILKVNPLPSTTGAVALCTFVCVLPFGKYVYSYMKNILKYVDKLKFTFVKIKILQKGLKRLCKNQKTIFKAFLLKL